MNTHDQELMYIKLQATLERQTYQIPRLEQHQIWLHNTGLSVPIDRFGFPEAEVWQ
jgi:hypothetical protein